MSPVSFTRGVLSCLLMTTISLSAFAENTTARLVRTGETQLTTVLSKDITRTEQYQDNYTEQVPYQDTEDYYENVPYTDRESYTDYEEYYDREYRCENYTDYERSCRNQRICRDVREPGRCRTVRECNPSNPNQCKEREVCEGGGSRQECHDEQRCENVPVRRERCDWENVRKTRPVTRYRDVTRYRQERRTRTVTRYREETRCCVTKTREVFDHTWSQQVQVLFPANHTLLPGEKETFQVTLAGTESRPDANIQLQDTIYGYTVARKSLSGRTVVIELASAPKYTAAELGLQTIRSAQLKITRGASVVQIVDEGLRNKVTTQYAVIVKDKSNGQVVTQAQSAAQGASMMIQLPLQLDPNLDYVVDLMVERNSVLLAAPVQFVKSFEYDHAFAEPALFADPTMISAIQTVGAFSSTAIRFADASPQHPEVNTTYKIIISKKGAAAGGQLIERTFNRNQIAQNADGSMELSLMTDFGVSPTVLDKTFKPGMTGVVEIIVNRTSAKLPSAISFKKQNAVQVR